MITARSGSERVQHLQQHFNAFRVDQTCRPTLGKKCQLTRYDRVFGPHKVAVGVQGADPAAHGLDGRLDRFGDGHPDGELGAHTLFA